MATWKVTPQWKKSIIERQEWIGPNKQRLIVETGWRWGEFHIETPPSDGDTPPVLEPGVDMFDCGYDCEMIETNDGCWEEYDTDESTREWLEEFLEEGYRSIFDLEDEGWTIGDCQMIIDCDMDIERID